MDNVIMFTPYQAWMWLLALCGGIVTISAAIVVVMKIVQWFKKPNIDQDQRLTSLEERVAKHDELFERDKDRLEDIESGNRVTQRAILALLDHGLDGNNLDQMRKAKNDLQKHLIER